MLTIDPGRAWSLTRDAGPTWRSTTPAVDQWPLWEDLLQRYAAAQLALAAHRTELLATGVPERSPATLPGQAAGLVAELSPLGADSGGLPVADARALRARLPAYDQLCRDLDGAGIPWTIQHDDLHANNICQTSPAGPAGPAKPAGPTGEVTSQAHGEHLAQPAAGARIIDWGDASIGHPFGTMLATLRSIAHHSGCEVDDPKVRRVRDAYLEPFTTYAPGPELNTLVDVARQVGAITRALSWRSALTGSPTTVQRAFDFPIRGWLLELLAAP